MKISELQKRLEDCKKVFGDLEVWETDDECFVSPLKEFIVAEIVGDDFNSYSVDEDGSEVFTKDKVNAVIINDGFDGRRNAGF